MTETAKMYADWLANPRNANHPDRALLQQRHDQLSSQSTPTSTAAQLTESDLANQVLASAGVKPIKAVAEPGTEADLANQVLASAGVKPIKAMAEPGTEAELASMPATGQTANSQAAAHAGFKAAFLP